MEQELTTSITAVTVYPDRALVVRHAEIAIEAAGEHTLRVGGLPNTLQRTSLRAKGHGPVGTRILGIEEIAEYHATAPEETLQRLREEIKRLEGELAALDEREKVLEEQRAWLATLAEQSARSLAWALARGMAKLEDATSLLGYASEESQRAATARLDLRRGRDDLRATLQARQREYVQLGGGKKSDRITASVHVALEQPGSVAIDLSYLIGEAAWRPRYDASVDVAAARVRLTQQALVSQRTGEDWTDAALTLSTAQPLASVALPDEPDPWYVDVLQHTPVAAAAAAPRLMMRAAAPMASSAAEERERGISMSSVSEPKPAEVVAAELATANAERSGIAQVFHLPGHGNVPSDGAPHTLSIGAYNLPCQLDYVAAPVVAPGAQLRARLNNGTGHLLPAGELHIFHVSTSGDEYVGATKLDVTPEGGEMTLYLGADDNMRVKRELIERDTDKGSILQGGVRRITYGYRVTLTNKTGEPQRVIYKDRLPVPRHERIKLRVLDLKPQPSERTRLEQLTWELRLAADEERRLEWRFVVEAPADLSLTGLP